MGKQSGVVVQRDRSHYHIQEIFQKATYIIRMNLSIALSLLLTVVSHETLAFTTTTTPTIKRRSTNNSFGFATRLFGILDEVQSDAYDLSSPSNENKGTEIDMNNAYEMFLAELVFSTNNPRVDIVNNLERATDPQWLLWLDNKIKTSRDPEERGALRDLHEMISDVVQRMEVSKLVEERQTAEKEVGIDAEFKGDKPVQKMTNADVLKQAAEIDGATSLDRETVQEQEEQRAKSFYEQELTPEIRFSYDKLLKQVLPPYKAGDTVESMVNKQYNEFDAQFVKLLTEEAANNADAQTVLECLSKEQEARMSVATANLKEVLAMGDPLRMEGMVLKMVRENKVDEAFLLLLEANANQARMAGANGPAELMDRLQKRAMEEKDKQAGSKEIRLVRKLLRATSAEERETILTDAFTPKEQLIVPGTAANAQKAADGELPEEQKPLPEVSPPDFINACKAVLLNFGNLGRDDDSTTGGGDEDSLAAKIKTIASEAEVVATRIYGKGMSVREQQDLAWKETTTSIFDLETMEIDAERRGEQAPWTNPDAPDDFIEGFDASGRMQVGGG